MHVTVEVVHKLDPELLGVVRQLGSALASIDQPAKAPSKKAAARKAEAPKAEEPDPIPATTAAMKAAVEEKKAEPKAEKPATKEPPKIELDSAAFQKSVKDWLTQDPATKKAKIAWSRGKCIELGAADGKVMSLPPENFGRFLTATAEFKV